MNLTDKEKHVLMGIWQMEVYYHQFSGAAGGPWFTWGECGRVKGRIIESLIQKGLVAPAPADVTAGRATSFPVRLTPEGQGLFA